MGALSPSLGPALSISGPGAGATLRPEQIAQLKDARALGGRVRRAIRYARFDAWTIAVFACVTALSSLTDPSGLALGVGMGVVAFVEFRGAARLRELDPAAARTLGFNQIAFAALLILYALWNIHATLAGPGPLASLSAEDQMVAEMLKPYEGLTRRLMLAVYGSLIAIAVLMQGSTAIYYFTRGKHVRAYLNETPPWILDLERAGVTI